MSANLTMLTGIALLVALIGSGGALTGRPDQAVKLSEAQFHENCVAENGRYVVLGRQIICTLGDGAQITCQLGHTLGNCLWTGQIEARTLTRLFSNAARSPEMGT